MKTAQREHSAATANRNGHGAAAGGVNQDELLRALRAVRRGDFSVRLREARDGAAGELARVFNEIVELNARTAGEFDRLATVVGKEGRIGQRGSLPGALGSWAAGMDSVNSLIGDLVHPTVEMARVIGSVARGNLTEKMAKEVEGKPLRGEFLRFAGVVNTMVDQLNTFASEVTRVAREVGVEGKLGGQAQVQGVGGTWKDLTDNVNLMAANLTSQVRNIAEVTTAVARGDLSKKITVDVRGEILELKSTINTLVDQLNSFASEVTRVAREVGVEGKLGGQAQVQGVGGTWKDLTDNVNSMAANLTSQVRNIADVTTAVARGDLSKKITVDVRGEILELKSTINTMVDQLNSFASEVTRVAREVGTEGKLGGQAQVKGVGGTWKDLTDNVNSMAANLTSQVRNIAQVTTAVANGDLSKKITVDVRGEILELKSTINTMVDQLDSFASEVTRVAREVGVEGKLGGQAQVKGVGGTWKDLTDNVNLMAANLTSQVRNIAQVTTAVANGDLSKKITVDVRGEILDLKSTINTLVDQLNSFASEVTRVAREVGVEGKLGGQAVVKGVGGTWKDLTDNVNSMAANLTSQVRNIADVTTAVARGDLSKKITVDVRGEILELKSTINTMVDQLNSFASEVTRVAREVGVEGKLGGQAQVKGVAGTWKDLTDNVNSMAANLTSQVRNIADVTTAVARGDLSKKITVDVRGEILELKSTINTMVDQLNSFASEVTRVAREVGVEGKLGGQALVQGVAGTWKDLTDNTNLMAANLTSQVRNIAQVTTAVANGDLSKKITVDVRGEILELKDTINTMVDQLNSFASEVTRVAREVGVEGKLGGQAQVKGVGGTWKDLTDNVNSMAANLTTQVRAIAEVATAVTKGDLTQSITVSALGEVEALKGNLNEMIRNLRETTAKNAEQDWLKTNLARFTQMMQGQRDLMTVSRMLLSELAPLVEAQLGIFYVADQDGEDRVLRMLASFAHRERKHLENRFKFGEGLVGQCALEKTRILLSPVPGDYLAISSGLGAAAPVSLVVLPVLFEGEVKAVIELGSFAPFKAVHLTFLEQVTESIGIVLNTISATMRTETLLTQSQALTAELQSQQGVLQMTNAELEEKARLLAEQNEEVERKNREVEMARRSLEEQAAQLALASRYKSQFLANMSHELRTPLNSLLILSGMLMENRDRNLSVKQVEYARTIRDAGTDLLSLIDDILDLAKVESGHVSPEVGTVGMDEVLDFVTRTFRQVADAKGLSFHAERAADVPTALRTDGKRLQQILKNLASNAFKFTEHGSITLEVKVTRDGWTTGHEALDHAPLVLSFSVRDTGIGIPDDKLSVIFEAFQQADASTSRQYGGTGLGLSISRELARLLGGEIVVESRVGEGSRFTLFLPAVYDPAWIHPGRPETSPPPAGGAPGPAALPETAPDEGAERSAVAVAIEREEERPIEDDRENLTPGERMLMIVEDDRNFAPVLLDLAHQQGFKGLISGQADQALEMVRRHRPDAITLDLRLIDSDGWTFLERLKRDPAIRHIPVHVISGMEDEARRAMKLGALTYQHKPASRESLERSLAHLGEFAARTTRRLLLVEDDATDRVAIRDLLAGDDVKVVEAATGEDALRLMREGPYDCLVLDLGLPDIWGPDLLRTVRADPDLRDTHVVVYTGIDLAEPDQAELRRDAEAVLRKGTDGPGRLIERTALHLHRAPDRMPEAHRGYLAAVNGGSADLAGRRVLLVDDDVRNLYSMTAVLERHGLEVLTAEGGGEALAVLAGDAQVDVVLMDIMMPVMDGYEATRAIRTMATRRSLPIIALTAKAMKGDRDRCLEAGATAYIAKPVDMDRLLSHLRVWLAR